MSLINEVAFTSDGSGAISVWEPKGGTLLMSYRGASVINPHSLCLLGNDYVLGVEKGKPMIQAWPVNSQEKAQLRMICPGKISAMQSNPDNSYIAVSIETKLHIWQIATGRLLATANGHYQPITIVKWSQDGNFIISGGEDGNVCVWQLSRLICKQTIAFGIPGTTSKGITGITEPLHVKSQHSLPVTDIFLSKLGIKSRVVSVSHDRTCKIFDLCTGEDLLSLIFDIRLSCVTFDLAEDNVFVGTTDGVIKTYSLRQVPRTRDLHVENSSDKPDFIGHEKTITALSCSVNGITLLSGSVDETIKIWHMFSRQCLKTIQHKGPVFNAFLTFLPPQLNEYDFNPKVLLKSFDKNIENSELEIEQYTDKNIQLNCTSFSFFGTSVNKTFETSSSSSNQSIVTTNIEETNAEIEKLKKVNKALYEFCMNNVINNTNIKKKKKKDKKKKTDDKKAGEEMVIKLGFKGRKKVKKNKFSKLKFNNSMTKDRESFEFV